MDTKASPLARLAPMRLWVRGSCLALAAIPALLAALAFTFSGRSTAQLHERMLYCALAFPPSQVARRAQLEAVYCKGLDADKQCQADFGWVVVSEPVPCN